MVYMYSPAETMTTFDSALGLVLLYLTSKLLMLPLMFSGGGIFQLTVREVRLNRGTVTFTGAGATNFQT